jgi:hypothetical protein
VNQFYLIRALLRDIARRKRLQDIEDSQLFDSRDRLRQDCFFSLGKFSRKFT